MADAERFPEVAAAAAELEAAVQREADRISAAPPDEAFQLGGQLWERVEAVEHRINAMIAARRAADAGRIWDEDRVSLAALANRIGVSKSRADQLLKAAKKGREES